MIHFFGNADHKVFAVQTTEELTPETTSKLNWLFSNPEFPSGAKKLNIASIDAFFVGPRAAMITPWSTNAVEITQNMGHYGNHSNRRILCCFKRFYRFRPYDF